MTDAAGRPVNTFKLAGYRLETVGSNPVDRLDYVRSGNAHARREFSFGIPLTIKAGVDCGVQTRDIRSGAMTYTHVGADGVGQTADDEVSKWFSERYVNRHAPWGLPIQEGISSAAVYESYKANPAHFQLTAANEITGYRNRVNASKRMTESIYAPYVRFDITSLLDRRLSITGGVRFERTEFEGVGPLINPAAIYQRDAAGNLVRNAAGQLVTIAPLATLAGTQLAYREPRLREAPAAHGFPATVDCRPQGHVLTRLNRVISSTHRSAASLPRTLRSFVSERAGCSP